MLLSKENQRVPEANLTILKDGKIHLLDSKELFEGRSVILFALPGAYTPTCSTTHVPGYSKYSKEFKKHGIDDILCLSVNDCFVMDSWFKDQQADGVGYVADGNGLFSEAMGMLIDKSELGFGKRSWRYSMLVRDGIIEKMFIEPEVEGDPFEVSDAETMLKYLAPDYEKPKSITMLSKNGCGHCQRARTALEEAGLNYEEVKLGEHGLSLSSLKALSGRETTPQVFVDGKLIGGADETIEWLQS